MHTDMTTKPQGEPQETNVNPMTRTGLPLLTNAPLCGAKTRAGTPCRCPAMKGRNRCLRHGGKSPGAPKGERNGSYKHGCRTNEAVELRSQVAHALKIIRSEAHAD